MKLNYLHFIFFTCTYLSTVTFYCTFLCDVPIGTRTLILKKKCSDLIWFFISLLKIYKIKYSNKFCKLTILYLRIIIIINVILTFNVIPDVNPIAPRINLSTLQFRSMFKVYVLNVGQTCLLLWQRTYVCT